MSSSIFNATSTSTVQKTASVTRQLSRKVAVRAANFPRQQDINSLTSIKCKNLLFNSIRFYSINIIFIYASSNRGQF